MLISKTNKRKFFGFTYDDLSTFKYPITVHKKSRDMLLCPIRLKPTCH